MNKNIEVTKIIPQGFCKGVVNAIRQINDIIKNDNYEKPLYMLGSLVHNKHITDALKEKGIITINDYNNISKGSIIVTAHGLSEFEKQKIKNKGLNLIDATCREVLKIQQLVKEKILENYTVIYYGKLNHPECKAIINIDPSIKLITSIDDINNLSINNSKIFFTNQTTMSYFDTTEIIDKLKIKYPNIEVNIDICNASKSRQIAVFNNASKFDIVLIVGDKSSNNTNKLKEICDNFKSVQSYLIENIDDLKNIKIQDNMKIGITAGASTPNKLVDDIINSIKDDSFISKLVNQDYINI